MSITQPNLVQQENRLKMLPDESLRTMLLQMGQSGQVGSPEYLLAAGEMQARKSLREKAAAGQPQQPPVIAQLLAPQPQAAPMAESGVGALPAPNLESLQQPEFANGGIVAFQAGGSTWAQRMEDAAMKMRNARREQYPDLFGLANEPEYAVPAPPSAPMTAGDLRRLEAAAKDSYVTGPGVPTYDPSQFPPLMQGTPQVRQPAGIAGLFDQASRMAGQIAPPLPTVPTTQASINEHRQAMTQAGFDPKLLETHIKSLKESSTSKQDRQEATNMRLLEAGLGIMSGTSPHAFVNVGRGASPALQGLAEDIKDIKKADRERERAIRELEVADNQAKAGVGLAAIKARQDAQIRLEQAQSSLATLKANMFQTLNSAETQRYVADVGLLSSREGAMLRRDDARQTKALELAERTVRENPKYLGKTDSEKQDLIQQYQRQYLRLLMQSGTGGGGGRIENGRYIPAGAR
jgi:hypothetical protein